MAFIELTSRKDGKKTIINTDQIIRFGELSDASGPIGSYIIYTNTASDQVDKVYMHFTEPSQRIEQLMAMAGILVHR